LYHHEVVGKLFDATQRALHRGVEQSRALLLLTHCGMEIDRRGAMIVQGELSSERLTTIRSPGNPSLEAQYPTDTEGYNH
jgi:hypothetical protein